MCVCRPESEFIEDIVTDILAKLRQICSVVPNELSEIDSHSKEMHPKNMVSHSIKIKYLFILYIDFTQHRKLSPHKIINLVLKF